MILLYTPRITPRLRYVADELFGRRLGEPVEITDNLNDLNKHPGVRINYSDSPVDGALQVYPSGLLVESGVNPEKPVFAVAEWWSHTCFPTPGDLPFDVFAASFYLLSRYEEYLPDAPCDEHGRFLHSASLGHQFGFHEIPLVDVWVLQLRWELEQRFAYSFNNPPHFSFLSTIDIDFAYRYRGTGLVRYCLKLFKSLVYLRMPALLDQLRVGIFYRPDPYDTYDWIIEQADANRLELRFFMLMKSGTRYDKNIHPQQAAFSSLIKKLSSRKEIGLHPSYYSLNDPALLKHEKEHLERLTGKKINHSRQHFLKYSLPAGMRELEQAGITNDYSCGYGNAPGFRAATSHPFRFFDLIENRISDLTLHPVVTMDVQFRNNPSVTPPDAMETVERLMNAVKKVNGTYINIWHNSNLSAYEGWKAWREVFIKLHTLASGKIHQEID